MPTPARPPSVPRPSALHPSGSDRLLGPRRPGRRRAPGPFLVRLTRRPVLWWATTLLLAGVTAQVVTGSLAAAEAGAARYGTTKEVLVASRDIEAGEVLDAGAAKLTQVPAALVAPGAAGAAALGSRATQRLLEGEVVHGERVAPAGLSAVAALLPDGTRGIAVPVDAGALPLERGDVVDVLATLAELGVEGAAPPTATVAAGALVVDVREAAVTVAVAEEDAGRVAYAVANGIVALALVPG